MRVILQQLVLLVVVLATFFFIYWVPFAFIPVDKQRWIPSIVALLCAALVGRFVRKRLNSAPAGLISNILLGAVMIGAIGFCIGFFGPIIFAPEANQGPLLGIFITGPLGFLLGGIGGFVYWLAKSRKVTVK